MRLLYSLLLVAGVALSKKTSHWQEEAVETSSDVPSLRGTPEVPIHIAAKLEKKLAKVEMTYEAAKSALAARSDASHKHSLNAAAKARDARMKERAAKKEPTISLAELQDKRNKLHADVRAKRKEARTSTGETKGAQDIESTFYGGSGETSLEVWTYFSDHRFKYAGSSAMYGTESTGEEHGPASFSSDMRNWEFHAFEVHPDLGHVYVRGTYGHFGYFEGEVYPGEWTNELRAYVKWMEADDHPGVHATLSGAAVLNYNMDYGDVYGERWRFDSTSGPWYDNTVGQWNSWAGVPVEYLGMDPYDTAKVLCFYSPGNDFSGDVENPRGYVYQAMNDRGMTTVMPTDAGSPIGGVLGGYIYKYSPKECRDFPELCAQYNRIETGHYGNDLLVNFQSSAVVLSGFWHALSGPKSGQVGTVLYGMMDAYDEEEMMDYSLMFGFHCDPTDYGKGGDYGYGSSESSNYYFYYGGDLGEGECYFEGYWRHHMKDRATVDHLMAMNRGNVRGLKRTFKSIYGVK